MDRRDVIDDILANAATLDERVAYHFRPLTGGQPELLQEWQERIAKNRPDLFDRRLSWLGTSKEDVLPLLGPVALPEHYPRPGWAEVLGRWLERLEQPLELEGLEPGALDQVPFWQFFAPLMAVASQALASRLARRERERLSAVWPMLQTALLEELGRIATRPLYVEFEVARNLARQRDPADWLLPEVVERSTVFYDDYVGQLCADRDVTLLRQYPVMARHCCVMAETWVHAVAEFAHRFDQELEALEKTFGPLGALTTLSLGLSDRHNEGRTAMALGFATGTELIYKPKTLEPEENFQRLLQWSEDHGFSLDFDKPRVLSYADHGWVERVPVRPCDSKEEVERFFHRVGGQLCLLYLLEGTDCHRENLLANGEQPVIVDLETLFHNREVSERFDQSPLTTQRKVWMALRYSVLETGLLPRWQQHASGGVFDVSGLAGNLESGIDGRTPILRNPNTDGMKLGTGGTVGTPSHRCRVQDEVVSATDFVTEIVGGFEEMHRCAREHREDLLASSGPIARMARQPVRILLRDTRTYGLVLRQALHPRVLENGAAFSVYLDVLARAYLGSEPTELERAFEYETAALQRLDIPIFSTRADSTDLLVGDRATIEGFYRTAAWSTVEQHITAQTVEDCERQAGYIRGALFTGIARTLEAEASSEVEALTLSSDLLLDEGRALQTASELVEQLEASAIRSDEGYPSWITLTRLVPTQEYQLCPMGPAHGDGLTGVAMFSSALYRLQGAARHLDLARNILDGVINLLEDPSGREELRRLGIGAGQGLSSCVYGLAKCGELLDDSKYTGEALKLAREITPDLIAADELYDPVLGSAGAIHVLSDLFHRTEENELKGAVALCADHLVTRSLQPRSGQRAWHTVMSATSLCGYSHGASGIAHALLRASRLLDREELARVAMEAFAFENAQFDESVGAWPDYRYPAGRDGHIYQSNWCNGSAGIGLARIAATEYLDDPQLVDDINRALRHSANAGGMRSDHLCCGYLGRMELWLTAGQKGFLEDGAVRARQLLGAMCERAQNLDFQTLWKEGPYNPTLFQGSSGIGYELLRAVAPETIPCVALWQ